MIEICDGSGCTPKWKYTSNLDLHGTAVTRSYRIATLSHVPTGGRGLCLKLMLALCALYLYKTE